VKTTIAAPWASNSCILKMKSATGSCVSAVAGSYVTIIAGSCVSAIE
jgi:hypothetical protein